MSRKKVSLAGRENETKALMIDGSSLAGSQRLRDEQPIVRQLIVVLSRNFPSHEPYRCAVQGGMGRVSGSCQSRLSFDDLLGSKLLERCSNVCVMTRA